MSVGLHQQRKPPIFLLYDIFGTNFLPFWFTRRRRVKCDEQRPKCKRCTTAALGCEYPRPPLKSRPVLILQPSSSIRPAGIDPVGYEAELFGCFRTLIVASLGGCFNHLFWRVDVPAAAQIHPSLWHSSLAIAAIHHSARLEKQRIRTKCGVQQFQSKYFRNHYYILALTHYNKSIQYLADTLGSRNIETLSYMEKEMIIINNILYMGICSMLEDTMQLQSHNTNFFNFLETIRFGEEDPCTRQGIVRFEDLLSVILAIDGSFEGNDKTKDRHFRSWVVRLPEYPRIETISDAYLEILPLVYRRLVDANPTVLPSLQGPSPENSLQKIRRSYSAKLDAFEKRNQKMSEKDRESLEMIRLYVQCHNLRAAVVSKQSRQEAIEHDAKWAALVDQIDDLQARTTPLDRPYSHEVAPITFAPSLGTLLGTVAGASQNVETRRKAVDLMKKWPFKESNINSEQDVPGFEAMIDFCLKGPERTRPWQRSGLPVQPTYENGGLETGTFDSCSGCECIYGIFICTDHRIRRYVLDTASSPARLGMLSHYELRHNLPMTWYTLEY